MNPVLEELGRDGTSNLDLLITPRKLHLFKFKEMY
jgi:hypothetical protein